MFKNYKKLYEEEQEKRKLLQVEKVALEKQLLLDIKIRTAELEQEYAHQEHIQIEKYYNAYRNDFGVILTKLSDMLSNIKITQTNQVNK